MKSPQKRNAPLCDKRRADGELTSESIISAGTARKRLTLSRVSARLPTAEHIKRSLSLVNEFEREGHALRRASNGQLKCLCPFHEERAPSCYISPEKGLFHCFGCGVHGSVIDYHVLKRGISVKSAIRELRERVGGVEQPICTDVVRVPLDYRGDKLKPLRLDYLERGTRDDICRLARLRSLSIRGLMLAQNDGVLRFANLCGHRAWVITDGARFVAQARRVDGGRWEHFDHAPKAWTLHGGRASWPVNAFRVPDRPKAVLVEGGADLLSAYHIVCSENRQDITPVAVLGASNSLHRVALPLFSGRRVRIYPHTDEGGITAVQRWHDQLIGVGAEVDCYDFAGLHRADAQPVTDLNDYLLVGYDEWEQVRWEEPLP
jgi:CHC2-type zinc finger protein